MYGAYIDDPIAMLSGGETYYYAKDRQYSVTAMMDSSGSIIESYEYNAFGIMTITDSSGNVIAESAVGNTYGFTGRRYDSESGLWHYRNRMYSAELGRFLQRDPKGFVDGLNLYAYVKNNPLKYVDAMGTTANFLNSFSNFSNVLSGYQNSLSSLNQFEKSISNMRELGFTLDPGISSGLASYKADLTTNLTNLYFGFKSFDIAFSGMNPNFGISNSDGAYSLNTDYNLLELPHYAELDHSYTQYFRDMISANSQQTWDSNLDGSLSLSEANNWWKNGNGETITINGNTVNSIGLFENKKGNIVGIATGSDYLIHGQVTINPENNHIYDGKYDFDIKGDYWFDDGWAGFRNLGTEFGKIWAGEGKPYEIQYRY